MCRVRDNASKYGLEHWTCCCCWRHLALGTSSRQTIGKSKYLQIKEVVLEIVKASVNIFHSQILPVNYVVEIMIEVRADSEITLRVITMVAKTFDS